MEYSLNRRSLLFFCIFLFIFTAGFGFSEETIHVIRQGETIYSIARSYQVSAQDVIALNKINDPQKVQIGTRLRIPGSGTPPPQQKPQTGYTEYRVEKNDTLYSLARRYGITLPELLDLNGFAPNYVIKAGEKIKVPARGEGIASGNTAVQNPPVKPPVTAVTNTPPVTTTTVSAPPARIDPAVRWPVKAKELSYITGKLYGVQITGERKEGVKSLTGGTVVSAGPYRGYGQVAIVQTAGGYLYVYGGCESLSVKEGDKIASGAELGKLGFDTKSSKSQLFFFVYKGNTPVDPAKAPRA